MSTPTPSSSTTGTSSRRHRNPLFYREAFSAIHQTNDCQQCFVHLDSPIAGPDTGHHSSIDGVNVSTSLLAVYEMFCRSIFFVDCSARFLRARVCVHRYTGHTSLFHKVFSSITGDCDCGSVDPYHIVVQLCFVWMHTR